MKNRLLRIAAALAAASAAMPVTAQPPPPPPPDPAFEDPVDGYDPQLLYSVWTFHVERQKSAAIDRLLEPVDDQPGLIFHRTIASFDRSADLGRFMAGRFETHCRIRDDYLAEPGSCIVVFRRAYFRQSTGEPLHRWTREQFDVPRLVGHLRDIALPPTTDWWRVAGGRIFSSLPSPLPILIALGTTQTLTEHQCPTMLTALRTMDGHQLPIIADLPGVGGDEGAIWAPAPHAMVATDRIYLQDQSHSTTIVQTGSTSILRPALNEVETCLREQSRPNG